MYITCTLNNFKSLFNLQINRLSFTNAFCEKEHYIKNVEFVDGTLRPRCTTDDEYTCWSSLLRKML